MGGGGTKSVLESFFFACWQLAVAVTIVLKLVGEPTSWSVLEVVGGLIQGRGDQGRLLT